LRPWKPKKSVKTSTVEKNKTAREDVFGEEDGTSTAGGRRVFLEVLELLQDPLRSHG
jgi:hypothetical protein